MFSAITEFISTQQGDSAEFIEKARALAVGVAQNYAPMRLYVIRIDNWFGPRWLHFAGKYTAGKGFAIGIHKIRLHVPPFVPHRVLAQSVFLGPEYGETLAAAPLHVECPSKLALSRRIEDIDKNAAFVWLSGQSEKQKRGSVMIYLPNIAIGPVDRHTELNDRGAFYIGFSLRDGAWKPAMLRRISLSEVAHLDERGQASIAKTKPSATLSGPFQS